MNSVLQASDFRRKLSELLDQDWFKIGISLNVKLRVLEKIRDDCIEFRKQENKAFEMLTEWFKNDEKPTFEKLKDAILNIPRYDLLKEVEDLANKFLNQSSNLTSDTSKRNSLLNSGDCSTMPLVLANNAPNTDLYYGELSTKSSVLSKGAGNPGIPIYALDSNSQGLCVILCNTKFKKLPERHGADEDVTTISETFLKLNFQVEIKVNQSRNQMFEIIKKCGNEDVNCLVCFISSYGELETVAGNDDELLTFEEIRSAINNNPANLLKKKPKIFFIQGEKVLKVNKDSIITTCFRKPDSKQKSVKASVVAKVADYCFSVATTPDHSAWRSDNGTVYFPTLCRIINYLLKTNERISLMNIVFRLNDEINNVLENALPIITYFTLREDVYFEKRRY